MAFTLNYRQYLRVVDLNESEFLPETAKLLRDGAQYIDKEEDLREDMFSPNQVYEDAVQEQVLSKEVTDELEELVRIQNKHDIAYFRFKAR